MVTGARPGWARAGRQVLAWIRGWTCSGQMKGGDVRVGYKNVSSCRNSEECHFGAVCLGKAQYFSQIFFQEAPKFSLDSHDFLEEKIRQIRRKKLDTSQITSVVFCLQLEAV